MKLTLVKEFSFEASHILPRHPGKCARLHGHSWKLQVGVAGDVNDETGFVMDYAIIKRFVEPIIEQLDHRHLGQWWAGTDFQRCIPTTMAYYGGNTSHCCGFLPPNFYPSSENLIVKIADQIMGQSDMNNKIEKGKFPWAYLELDETCTSSCILTREDYENAIRNV